MPAKEVLQEENVDYKTIIRRSINVLPNQHMYLLTLGSRMDLMTCASLDPYEMRCSEQLLKPGLGQTGPRVFI